jgi:hypothetical protein
MALLDTEKAQQIQGIHFSAQHQADTKGKQEGRVIGDLSGQHDPAYTPLNGTSDSKDALRREIAQWENQASHSRPISAHGSHSSGRPWLGQIGTMEKGLERRFQPPEL